MFAFASFVANSSLTLPALVFIGSGLRSPWPTDMRPGNIAGLTRASYLRELFGQVDGAIELMQSAYTKTNPAELEDRAWILTQIAHLHLLNGKPDIAETLLAEALVRAGKDEEAKIAFAEFESKALAESEGFDNANRELTFYFADHADKPKEALRIAELEIARRQDLQTLHAYAWALYVNGKFAEAREQIDKALAVGTRDPALLYHAGVIAMKAGDTVMAQRHLEASLAQTPNSEVATSARDALAAFQK